MKRVIAYIDGFNLYYGLKSKGWERYLWLNVQALASNLLKVDQTLSHTKYFTARVGPPADKVKRQATYLDAIGTLENVSIHFGHYQSSPRECRNCGFTYDVYQEKMTDVNIAVELLRDAFHDAFDTALLISADSDLIAPLAAVKDLFPQKRVVVASPPGRFSVSLSKAASAYFQIDRIPIAKSQFPAAIATASGFVLQRPSGWTSKQ